MANELINTMMVMMCKRSQHEDTVATTTTTTKQQLQRQQILQRHRCHNRAHHQNRQQPPQQHRYQFQHQQLNHLDNKQNDEKKRQHHKQKQQQQMKRTTSCSKTRGTTSGPCLLKLLGSLILILALVRSGFALSSPASLIGQSSRLNLAKVESSSTTDQLPVKAIQAPPSGFAQTLPVPQALMASSAPSPQVRTVNPGDRVNIPCSLANMGGSIQFAKDDQPIILDSGCAHCQLDISNDGQASLTINRVSSKDQGHWQCWRLDANGKVKQKIPIIQLVITNSPELPILIVNDKELLGGNSLDATITVKENEMVNFKCVIKGAASPVDYVHWMLDSSQNVTHLSQLMMEYSPVENNYLTQSILKLNATKSMNLKSISCLSNHQLWLTPMTVTAFLNVLYEPSFTISREPGFGIPVSEGMTVILKCEIDSNPSSSPVWIKDADNKTAAANNQQQANIQQQQQVTGKEASGEPIVLDTQDDGSVIFQPAQRSDSGWYRCKTENKYGNFSSFGYYLNVRPSSSSGGNVATAAASPAAQHLGSNHQQHQQQQPVSQPRYSQPPFARPETIYGSQAQQQQQGKVLAPNQPAAQKSNQRVGSSASSSFTSPQFNMMNNDQPSMAAHQSFNQAPLVGGEQQNRCEPSRQVDGSPRIDPPVSTVSAVLGRQLILPLRFCCNPGPAHVFWIHRHLAMIPGRMFGPYITRDIYNAMNSFYCYESTFEIESVKPEDIGTVYVFVTNEKGHAGAQIHIQLANKHEHNSLGSRFMLSPANSGTASTSQSVILSTYIFTCTFITSCLLALLTKHHYYNAHLQHPTNR